MFKALNMGLPPPNPYGLGLQVPPRLCLGVYGGLSLLRAVALDCKGLGSGALGCLDTEGV